MTSRDLLARLFVSMLVLGSVAIARADIAPPAPESLTCPRGAYGAVPEVAVGALDPRGRPLRPWPYCAASTCTSDTDCTDGRVCSVDEIGLCIEDHPVSGGTTVRSARDRACEPDGTCLALTAACERARRCVAPEALPTIEPAVVEPVPPPPPAPPAPPAPEMPPQSTWGCSAAASSPSLLVALLPLLVLVGRRRSRTTR